MKGLLLHQRVPQRAVSRHARPPGLVMRNASAPHLVLHACMVCACGWYDCCRWRLRVHACMHAGQKTLPPKFRLLDRDGIAAVGDYILPGDIYLNMQRPTNTRDPIQPNMPDTFYK